VSTRSPSDRVGPNAALQTFAALRARGEGSARAVAARAGLSAWLDTPPQEMIPQADAARLHEAVRAELPPSQADAVLADAGRRTADYLLANRIPGFAQILLRALPASLAARGLTKAIAANAWTFAGSGRFEAKPGPVYEIYDNPFCAGASKGRKLCVWHAAVFERLFQALVSRQTAVEETACCAEGSPCCRFRLNWR